MPDESRTDRMNDVTDVFVEEFRTWAMLLRTPDARLHLSGYVGTTVICVYEPWPARAPGLLIGDVIEDDWDREESVAGLFLVPVVEMLEPRGTRNFQSTALADRSFIHWDPTLPFDEGVPRTPEQLQDGVVPPGFVSRLPDPWPGPAPAPPRQPRPPLRKMLSDLGEFAVAYSLFRIQRRRDD